MPTPEHVHRASHDKSTRGPIRYLDGKSLHMPVDMPKQQVRQSFIFVAIAAIIGIIIFVNYYNTVVVGAENEAKKVNETINRGVTLDLPHLADYATLDNDTIKSVLTEAGYTLYDNSSSADTAAGGMDIYKLPSDVTLADAAVAYASGISKLSADSAAKYLTGSWRLLTNHSSGTELKLRYADFNSTTANAAISNAIATEGFDSSTAGEIGTDSVGNTIQSGTVVIDDATYYWTVSTCALSSVYSNDGLPSTAQYVGIRLATSNS